ncbi:MAG: cysteine-rich CWC family protein [Dinghuibacter sp.]|nr:cysteine-rich CWC family protein [Dinghuibacter sp.]
MEQTGGTINCVACQQPFRCQPENIQACGWSEIILNDAARQWIKERYAGCLCPACLKKIQQQFA